LSYLLSLIDIEDSPTVIFAINWQAQGILMQVNIFIIVIHFIDLCLKKLPF